MLPDKTIKIARSRVKILLGLVFCVFCILMGIWGVTHWRYSGVFHPVFTLISGIFFIVMFGGLSIRLMRWLFNSVPGLIIDADGICDNTVAGLENRVAWQDVDDISQWKYLGQKMVVILLHDPHCYIDGHPAKGRRKALLFNLKKCGSPVVISAAGLNISHRRLLELLQKELAAYRQSLV